jgi:hypothetical protein
VGTGEKAEQSAAEDTICRTTRQAEAEAYRHQRHTLKPVDTSVRDLTHQMGALAKAVLFLNGFYRHERSQWRRRGH